MFSNKEEVLLKSPEDPNAKLFSILKRIESFRLGDEHFHLKLNYSTLPENRTSCHEWYQTVNPSTEGFNPVHLTNITLPHIMDFIRLDNQHMNHNTTRNYTINKLELHAEKPGWSHFSQL